MSCKAKNNPETTKKPQKSHEVKILMSPCKQFHVGTTSHSLHYVRFNGGEKTEQCVPNK